MLKNQLAEENLAFVFQEQQFCCVKISSSVYRLEAILKATYKFTDKCYIHVEPATQDKFLVRFKTKNQCYSSQELAHEFCNELLDQELRIIIAQETEAVRNLIMAHAFSKTALIEPELEIADYIEDPLKIGRQDEKF
jgi:His-Xaa-Ser system protein HxsD